MQVFDIAVDQTQKEIMVHGTTAFPVAIYHSIMSRNILGFTPWHWHEELQFCFVTKGEIRFYVGETQYHLKTGDGIFINQEILHSAKPMGDLDSTYICLNFAQVLLYGNLNSIFHKKYILPFQRDPSLEIIPLYQDMAWQAEVLAGVSSVLKLYEEAQYGYEYDITSILSDMWIKVLLNRPHCTVGASQKVSHNQTIQKIISFIEQNFSERITVDMIAREVSFSGAECCRIFKRFTGETIFTFLRSYRLEQATTLLQQSENQVSQIALETGFCSTSYFIKTFRDCFGITPYQYKQKYEGTNLIQNGSGIN